MREKRYKEVSLFTSFGGRGLRAGCDGIVVLGHPQYYPRFGFVPASNFGIKFPGKVADEAFMALPLRDGGLDGRTGAVVYHTAFGLNG